MREICFRAWTEDPEAVAATLPDPPFAPPGMSRGGALAISHALRHPERMSHLILDGAYGQGAAARTRTAEERLEAEILLSRECSPSRRSVNTRHLGTPMSPESAHPHRLHILHKSVF